MTNKGKGVLTPHNRRKVAVEAQCVEKTVGAYLDGKKLQPSTQERVENALKALGYENLVRAGGTG